MCIVFYLHEHIIIFLNRVFNTLNIKNMNASRVLSSGSKFCIKEDFMHLEIEFKVQKNVKGDPVVPFNIIAFNHVIVSV